MKGLFHMSVTIMLSLGGLLLKLLVLPNIGLGDFFLFSLFFSIHILSLFRVGEARWGRQWAPEAQPAVPQGCAPEQWRRI